MRYNRTDIKLELIPEEMQEELIDYAESFAINFGSVRIVYDLHKDVYKLYAPLDKRVCDEQFSSVRELQAFMRGVMSGVHGRFKRLPIEQRKVLFEKHNRYRKERESE